MHGEEEGQLILHSLVLPVACVAAASLWNCVDVLTGPVFLCCLVSVGHG